MTVTCVESVDNRKNKVFIDGHYAFPLYGSEIRKYHIEQNAELSDETMSEITNVILRRIRERILYLIGDMDRSETDIRTKLEKNGYTQEYIDPVISELKECGYIDDRRYAISYAQSLIDGRHAGISLIKQRLYLKGIPRDIIDETVNELEFDEEEQMEAAIRKKNMTKKELVNSDCGTKRKIYAYLMRKGFSSSSVIDFMTEL